MTRKEDSGFTSIRLPVKLVKEIDSLKLVKSEPHYSVIQRLVEKKRNDKSNDEM